MLQGSRPQPFPRPGERLVDGTRVEYSSPDGSTDDLWASMTIGGWPLTIGGRLLVCWLGAVDVLGLLGVGADAVFGGVRGDQAGGLLLVFVILLAGALLASVVGVDAAFRAIRKRVTHKPG